MMVVDASVWVSRLVPQDVYHIASDHWLRWYLSSGGLIAAPMILLAEVAGPVSRRTGDPTLGQRAIRHLVRLAALRLIPIDRQLGRQTAQLAAELRLRGADATYIALADHLKIPLVTWDHEQRERAPELVTVYTPDSKEISPET